MSNPSPIWAYCATSSNVLHEAGYGSATPREWSGWVSSNIRGKGFDAFVVHIVTGRWWPDGRPQIINPSWSKGEFAPMPFNGIQMLKNWNSGLSPWASEEALAEALGQIWLASDKADPWVYMGQATMIGWEKMSMTELEKAVAIELWWIRRFSRKFQAPMPGLIIDSAGREPADSVSWKIALILKRLGHRFGCEPTAHVGPKFGDHWARTADCSYITGDLFLNHAWPSDHPSGEGWHPARSSLKGLEVVELTGSTQLPDRTWEVLCQPKYSKMVRSRGGIPCLPVEVKDPLSNFRT